jgi:hypothetical protein
MWSWFVIGAGATMAVGQAQARLTDTHAQAGAVLEANVELRLEGDLVLISEQGGAFRPLPAQNCADAELLRALLRAQAPDGKAVRVRLGPSIVADGASGWHRDPP